MAYKTILFSVGDHLTDSLTRIIAAIPAGRLGAPAGVGRMAAFLASDDAGYITGATFDVNGGQFMG